MTCLIRTFKSLASKHNALIWTRRHLVTRSSASSSSTSPPSNRKILVSHLLIKDKTKSQLLEELENKIQAQPTSWTALVQEHSECPSSKREGQLGWLQTGSYYPEFEEAAFATQVGKVSRASTALGLHLIKVLEERMEASIQQIDVQELSEIFSNPALYEDVQFVDVREDWEFNTSKLPFFKLFPLSKFEECRSRIPIELDSHKETMVLCHHGVRSMQMAQYLVSQCGFTNVKNITGGIHAYSTQVDSSVPLY